MTDFYPHYPLTEQGLRDCQQSQHTGILVVWRQRRGEDPPQTHEHHDRTYLIVKRSSDQTLGEALLFELARVAQTGGQRFFVQQAGSDLVAEDLHRQYYVETQPLLGDAPI